MKQTMRLALLKVIIISRTHYSTERNSSYSLEMKPVKPQKKQKYHKSNNGFD